MKDKIKGLAIHLHHDKLAEYCYDYNQRVEEIKNTKPLAEQEIRLRLFKILPEEALKDTPVKLQKADAEWKKAYAEWDKACAERDKAYAKWDKACAERDKAYAELKKATAELSKACAEWSKAYAEWSKADKDAFHTKWCGCIYWENGEISFNKK